MHCHKGIGSMDKGILIKNLKLNDDEELRFTNEYKNCNGVKECVSYYPECVILGVDYTPAYKRLSCTSEGEFQRDAVVDVESGLTCRDAGLLFEIDALNCADAE